MTDQWQYPPPPPDGSRMIPGCHPFCNIYTWIYTGVVQVLTQKQQLRQYSVVLLSEYIIMFSKCACLFILFVCLQNNFPSNPWYDKECKSLKYVVNNIAKHRDFNAQQGEYNILLRQYKQLIQRKKRQYQQAKLSELVNMRTEDPNSYWKF